MDPDLRKLVLYGLGFGGTMLLVVFNCDSAMPFWCGCSLD